MYRFNLQKASRVDHRFVEDCHGRGDGEVEQCIVHEKQVRDKSQQVDQEESEGSRLQKKEKEDQVRQKKDVIKDRVEYKAASLTFPAMKHSRCQSVVKRGDFE